MLKIKDNAGLQEGMYVRTAFGIKRICEINQKAEKWKYLYKLKKQDGDGCIDLGQLCDDDIIDAPSFNVIDLIEEGDYVNGYMVLEVKEQYIKLNNPKLNYDAIDYERIFKNKYSNMAIRDVVTKEQFENMMHIVESE